MLGIVTGIGTSDRSLLYISSFRTLNKCRVSEWYKSVLHNMHMCMYYLGNFPIGMIRGS